jgi:hypothetical protein
VLSWQIGLCFIDSWVVLIQMAIDGIVDAFVWKVFSCNFKFGNYFAGTELILVFRLDSVELLSQRVVLLIVGVLQQLVIPSLGFLIVLLFYQRFLML